MLFFHLSESLEEYAESMEEAKNLSDFINNAIKTHDKKVRPNAGGKLFEIRLIENTYSSLHYLRPKRILGNIFLFT